MVSGICILLALAISVYYLLGKAVCVRYRWNLTVPEEICVGFFLYFALFQVIAEIMILTKQKLHVLGNTWLIILILLLATAAACIVQEGKKKNGLRIQSASVKKIRPSKAVRVLTALMAAAVIGECAAAVLLQRNMGWDFAYYMGNLSTSAATDTMYLYDGSTGLLRRHMELRYSLSSFYMNTAWIGQMTGISPVILQKYCGGMLCVLLSNGVVYSFAMEVFRRDKKKTAVLVILTVVLTMFWDVYAVSAQFLMLRNYEAKAYCANVVLPMCLYLSYRIWKDDSDMRSWAELFIVALASVPVSMSSLVLVPALTGIMLLAHLLVERRWNAAFIRRTVYCLLPNICYLLVYFLYSGGWLAVEV